MSRLNPIGLECAELIFAETGDLSDAIRAYVEAEYRAVGFTIQAHEFPRDDLAQVMFAAWLNVQPKQLPRGMKNHPNEHTMKAWARVGEAAIQYAQENPQ